MAMVRVILRLVSRIFNPIEKRRIKKIEQGNIRKAVNTWIHKIHESWKIFSLQYQKLLLPISHPVVIRIQIGQGRVPKVSSISQLSALSDQSISGGSTEREIIPGSLEVR